MNKSFLRLTITLVLVIVLLVLLLFAAVSGFTAIWLNTYKAFTKEELVAELSVTDMPGDEFKVELKQVEKPAAFSGIFNKASDEKDRFGEIQNYVMRGDQFELGGEVIKFNNWVTFLGFETVYKLSRLESDYSNAAEAQRKDRSVNELNGGTDSYWKSLEKNQNNLKSLVDTVYGSYAGKFVQNGTVSYGLYITEDGFILDELETINSQ